MLKSTVLTNYGYNQNSKIFEYFIDYVLTLDETEKRKLISFITGCPRLPVGGIKNLTPKLTIVKRQLDKHETNPDKFLPTVMT